MYCFNFETFVRGRNAVCVRPCADGLFPETLRSAVCPTKSTADIETEAAAGCHQWPRHYRVRTATVAEADEQHKARSIGSERLFSITGHTNKA